MIIFFSLDNTSVIFLIFFTPLEFSILGTIVIYCGMTSMYFFKSLGDSTFEIAKYSIFGCECIIGIRSSKEYLLLGGFVLPIGRSRKIICLLCFRKIFFNSSKSLTHAKLILKMASSGIDIL